MITIFLLLLFSFAINTQAKVSLGSVQDRKSADIFQDDSTVFKILLFNAHDTARVLVKLSVESPQGFTVYTDPREIYLDYKTVGDTSRESGYEYLGTAQGTVKARPVRVYVRSLSNANTGTYRIKVSATAGSEGDMFSLYQERDFFFDVTVKERPKTPAQNQTSGSQTTQSKPGENSQNQQASDTQDAVDDEGNDVKGNETVQKNPEIIAFVGDSTDKTVDTGGLTGMVSYVPGMPFIAVVFISITCIIYYVYWRRE